MRVGYLVAAAAVVAAVPLGLLWLDGALDQAAWERAQAVGACCGPDPLARPSTATKALAAVVGVVALLGARYLLRPAKCEERVRRLVPWLLTLGLAIATLARTWQGLESSGRDGAESLLLPPDVPTEPAATLVARIRASWEPGDRLRTRLLLVGLALCAAAAWRAWRVEGLPASTLRRVALALAILGTSNLAFGLLRKRTHPHEWSSATYVSVHYPARKSVGPGPHDIGFEDVIESGAPPGVAPLMAAGKVWLGLGALLGLLSLLHARRADSGPASSTTLGAPRREGG